MIHWGTIGAVEPIKSDYFIFPSSPHFLSASVCMRGKWMMTLFRNTSSKHLALSTYKSQSSILGDVAAVLRKLLLFSSNIPFRPIKMIFHLHAHSICSLFFRFVPSKLNDIVFYGQRLHQRIQIFPPLRLDCFFLIYFAITVTLPCMAEGIVFHTKYVCKRLCRNYVRYIIYFKIYKL